MSEPLKLADLLMKPVYLGAPSSIHDGHAEWLGVYVEFHIWTQARRFELQMDAGNGAWRCHISRFLPIEDARAIVRSAMEEARFLGRINESSDPE